MEIRQVSADERTDTMFPLQAYAFFASPWAEEDRETYRRRMVYYRSALSLVAQEDGRSLACVGAFPMRQNVRGAVLDMAGVASVAAHPEARRRGFVRALLERLLREMRERGCVVSSLYPFRPSFYGRLGYVGLPRRRTADMEAAGLGHLLRVDLPGTVHQLPMREAFETYDDMVMRMLEERHGWAVFDDVRKAEFREDKTWVAVARTAGLTVGAVSYRIDGYGGRLVASDLLTTGPLGRALLLQFLARHVDQVERIVVTVGPDDVPELWGTDLAVTTESTVSFPRALAPMARVLDVPGLTGMPVGEGDLTVEVVDDDLTAGLYRLTGDDGRLSVSAGGPPGAVLTAAGLSGLVYGVLDPVDVVARGLGQITGAAMGPLRGLFPRAMPYLFANF